jgi:hypothetical protein
MGDRANDQLPPTSNESRGRERRDYDSRYWLSSLTLMVTLMVIAATLAAPRENPLTVLGRGC